MADSKSEKGTEKKEPEYEYSESTVSFTDVINVNIRNDYVHLGIGLRDINDSSKVTVTHKIYMTLDHFLRFSDLCNNLSSEIKKQVEKQGEESGK